MLINLLENERNERIKESHDNSLFLKQQIRQRDSMEAQQNELNRQQQKIKMDLKQLKQNLQ
jgi:hypothetical protein